MVMSYFWCLCMLLSVISSLFLGREAGIAAAIMEGAATAITTSMTIAGPLSLWSGLGNLMERFGLSDKLAYFLQPVLYTLYPSCRTDPALGGSLSANVCANLLGLGNAATPMGIRAAQKLADPKRPGVATDELCRLVVMNTASIQLLPTTVAALRSSAGCASPFDILPCVWISSILSVSAGLICAELLRRVWPHV